MDSLELNGFLVRILEVYVDKKYFSKKVLL